MDVSRISRQEDGTFAIAIHQTAMDAKVRDPYYLVDGKICRARYSSKECFLRCVPYFFLSGTDFRGLGRDLDKKPPEPRLRKRQQGDRSLRVKPYVVFIMGHTVCDLYICQKKLHRIRFPIKFNAGLLPNSTANALATGQPSPLPNLDVPVCPLKPRVYAPRACGKVQQLCPPFDISSEFAEIIAENRFSTVLWDHKRSGLKSISADRVFVRQELELHHTAVPNIKIHGSWGAAFSYEPVDYSHGCKDLGHAVLQSNGVGGLARVGFPVDESRL
jgi:hypothetical protein